MRMAHLPRRRGVMPPEPRLAVRSRSSLDARALIPVALGILAVGFIAREVITYLDYSPESWGRFWPQRFWLALHLIGGAVALLIGPLQFVRRLRTQHPRIHRWTGRVYIGGVAVAATGAFRLSFEGHPVLGFGFGAALFVMAVVWIVATGMAWAAIRSRAVSVHREWMVRSYILTFSFVTFRLIMAAVGGLGWLRVAPPAELAPMFVWSAWVLPIVVAEVILAARRIGERNRGRLPGPKTPVEKAIGAEGRGGDPW